MLLTRVIGSLLMMSDKEIKHYYNLSQTINGKGNIGNTPENKGQCVGLAFAWILNLRQSHFYGHAKDLYANAPSSEYTKIKNSQVLTRAGDIIVWNSSMGGGFGHIAVVIGSSKTSDSFTVFEQNNPA